jgi:hypothetical protein
VQSGGGLVTVMPSKLSYTNGEVVTLSATLCAGYFSRLTGDKLIQQHDCSGVMTPTR